MTSVKLLKYELLTMCSSIRIPSYDLFTRGPMLMFTTLGLSSVCVITYEMVIQIHEWMHFKSIE